jgi:hypothetical protein
MKKAVSNARTAGLRSVKVKRREVSMENKPESEPTIDKNLAIANAQVEIANSQVKIAEIQANTMSGWQTVTSSIADLWEKHDTKKSGSEQRYNLTLTLGILIILTIITIGLGLMTFFGKINGDSLIFFLGTLSGSLITLIAERIKAQKE